MVYYGGMKFEVNVGCVEDEIDEMSREKEKIPLFLIFSMS